ncbi:MAG: nucleotidyltransferase domain-containing protein [Bdellovibrionota bacterium]
MRLTESDKVDIKKVFDKYSTSDAKIYLFGSRLDDSKKGGDIDLLIIFADTKNLAKFKKLDFIVDLKKAIGERKIDVTLAALTEIPGDVFLQSILESAVQL